jgi:hypothetical protein
MSVRRVVTDSDLAAIAALATTAFGRSFLAAANAAAVQSLAGTVIGTNVQAWAANLDLLAAQASASFGRGLLNKASKEEVQQSVQQPGVMLGLLYNVTGGNKSTTSATQADVDATNALVTFTTPASGQVLIRCVFNGNVDANLQNAFVGLREGTTDIAAGIFAMQGMAAAGRDDLITASFYLSGLSAGAVHTYKLAFSVAGGATFTIRQAAASPVTMEVWANAVPVAPPADGIDRAASILATGDSHAGNHVNLTDGNDSSSSSGYDNVVPRYYEIDLGVSRYIYSARMVWSDGSHVSRTGSIQYLNETTSTWVDIATWTNDNSLTKTPAINHAGRYWRLRTTVIQPSFNGLDTTTWSLFS